MGSRSGPRRSVRSQGAWSGGHRARLPRVSHVFLSELSTRGATGVVTSPMSRSTANCPFDGIVIVLVAATCGAWWELDRRRGGAARPPTTSTQRPNGRPGQQVGLWTSRRCQPCQSDAGTDPRRRTHPYPHDDRTFGNREGCRRSGGYYKEYTSDPGPMTRRRRIIKGARRVVHTSTTTRVSDGSGGSDVGPQGRPACRSRRPPGAVSDWSSAAWTNTGSPSSQTPSGRGLVRQQLRRASPTLARDSPIRTDDDRDHLGQGGRAAQSRLTWPSANCPRGRRGAL
jgi:hypothetical protein